MDTHQAPVVVNRKVIDEQLLNLLDEQGDLSDRFDDLGDRLEELHEWDLRWATS